MRITAPFDMIRQWWTTTFRRFSVMPFIFILIGLELYFYINGPAHFPDWNSTFGQIIPVYVLMTVFFLVWASAGTRKELRRPLNQSAPWFVIFFIITYILMFFAVAIGIFHATSMTSNLFWPTVILQICVVATSEELMFRGVILEVTRSVIISSILFAVWHGYAYGFLYYAGVFNWGAMVFAFVMGVILALVTRKYGLPAAIGIHAAYNLTVAGVLVTGF